jgi:diguanylate cyclase (GGDEF)-like protein
VVPIPGGPMSAGHGQAWAVLAAGLLVGGLVLANMSASGRYARRIEALARTDPLTGLSNRRGFVARLAMAFAAAGRGGSPFAVLCVDLDEFKDVNDTLGHPIGDLLLRNVVERLEKAGRKTDLVARFGGDEFAILQADAADPAATGMLAMKLVRTLAGPYMIEGNELRVTASIGISSYGELSPFRRLRSRPRILFQPSGECGARHATAPPRESRVRANTGAASRRDGRLTGAVVEPLRQRRRFPVRAPRRSQPWQSPYRWDRCRSRQ